VKKENGKKATMQKVSIDISCAHACFIFNAGDGIRG